MAPVLPSRVQRQWRAGAILPNRRHWQPTTFTKNRDRLLAADVVKEFLAEVVNQAKQKGLTSDEHFTVDWTLIEAWASLRFERIPVGTGFLNEVSRCLA